MARHGASAGLRLDGQTGFASSNRQSTTEENDAIGFANGLDKLMVNQRTGVAEAIPDAAPWFRYASRTDCYRWRTVRKTQFMDCAIPLQ